MFFTEGEHCAHCGRIITPGERTSKTYLGTLCEICTEKVDALTPIEDDMNNEPYETIEPTYLTEDEEEE